MATRYAGYMNSERLNTLREGIIKEIHDNGKFNRYVVVDNLTTGRQNKWGDCRQCQNY